MPKRSLPVSRRPTRPSRNPASGCADCDRSIGRTGADAPAAHRRRAAPASARRFQGTSESRSRKEYFNGNYDRTRYRSADRGIPTATFKDPGKAIEFYKQAFGAKETFRFENEMGIGHAEIMIGDSVIMIAGEWPDGERFSAETLGSSPIWMTILVPDVDAFAAHAVAAGARLRGAIADQFYGRRDATLLDPFGYTWNVSTVKEEMSVEEMHRRFNAMMKGQEKKKPAVEPVPKGYTTLTTYLVAQDADGLIQFMTKAFGAEETFRTGPGSEGGLHAEVKIGDSMLMVGGGGAGMKWHGTPMPSAFHMYVPDCDATYARALEAGATSMTEPADQEYGERSRECKGPCRELLVHRDLQGRQLQVGRRAHAATLPASSARRTRAQIHQARFRSGRTRPVYRSRRRDPPYDGENWKCVHGDGRSHWTVSTHANDVLSLRGRLRCAIPARPQRGGDFNLGSRKIILTAIAAAA